MSDLNQSWAIRTRYFSCTHQGSAKDVARFIVNLINLQGPGEIAITPARLEDVRRQISELDPTNSWHRWWDKAAAEQVRLVSEPPTTLPLPWHSIPATWNESGNYLGINAGGHFLRIVSVRDGHVERSITIRTGTGDNSLWVGAGVPRFVELVRTEFSVEHVSGIGIAWSAPRTSQGLRAMSILMDNAGELSDLLHNGELDNRLTQAFQVPVSSWHDGESVAAAEATYNPRILDKPALILKLGTSMACGLVTKNGVLALPMQGAKCLPNQGPAIAYSHPQTGHIGTIRDMVGAEALLRSFRRTTTKTATYDDYQSAVLTGETAALQLFRDTVRGVTELTQIVCNLWPTRINVIVSGKNLDQNEFRHFFNLSLRQSLLSNRVEADLLEATCDHDLAAALGAVCLHSATMKTFP